MEQYLTARNDIPYLIAVSSGIIGNALVILSIIKQRSLLKSNYYYMVLHLAICDFLFLIVQLPRRALLMLSFSLKGHCFFTNIVTSFAVAGFYLMAIISVLRYRATVHPLKPSFSRRKLNKILTIVYIFSFVMGYLLRFPFCLSLFVRGKDFSRFLLVFRFVFVVIFFFLSVPTAVFLTIIYSLIARGLFKQGKTVQKELHAGASNTSAINLQRHIRNRKIFLVCFTTAVCFLIGNLPVMISGLMQAVGYQFQNFSFVFEATQLIRICGCHSVNPLIYGILDRKLVTFWKHCQKKKPKDESRSVPMATMRT